MHAYNNNGSPRDQEKNAEADITQKNHDLRSQNF